MVVESLKHSSRQVCQAAIKCLSGLGEQAEFQQEISTAIPMLVESVKHSDLRMRLSASLVLERDRNSSRRSGKMIPMVVKWLKQSNLYVHQAALQCLSGLGAQWELQQDIRAAIPIVVESLKDTHPDVHQDAIKCLYILGAQREFQQDIRAAIPMVD
ncbi:armadillo-type protein [Mycena leptocephala]|nr:armadillo-type protein [Mycena leptocephala]